MAANNPSRETPSTGTGDSQSRSENVFAAPSGGVFATGLSGAAPLGSLTNAPKTEAHHPAPIFAAPPLPLPTPDWTPVLDSLPYGLLVLGPEQQVRHENAAFRQLLGHGVAEQGGIEGWFAAVCPDLSERETVIHSWREHLWRNQLPRTYTLKTAEGKSREIEFRSSLLPDGGITLTMEDVTKRKRSDDLLLHAKRKFRALFSSTATGTVLADRSGRIIDANPAFVALCGTSLKELRLTSLADLFHPDEATALARAEEAVARASEEKPHEERSASLDLCLRTPVGEKRTRATYCPLGDGRVAPDMGIYLFNALDATPDRGDLAARLKSVSDKARALLQTVPDLVLLVDEDGKVSDFAPPPRPWDELSPDEGWRNRPAEEVWPVFGHLLRQCSARVLDEGRTLHADLRSPATGGFEFSVTLAPCGDRQILAVVRNQTALRSLRERERWERSAFLHSPFPTLRLDAGGRVADANTAAIASIGLAENALIGREFSSLVNGDGRIGPGAAPERGTGAGQALGAVAEFLALEEGTEKGSLVFFREIDRDAKPPPPNPSAAPAGMAASGPSLTERRQHAFRNQLQLVTSLFSLEPQGTEAREAFLRWQIRLRALALASPHEPGSSLWVAPLIRDLADQVCSLLARGPGRREVIVTGDDDLVVDPNTASPFALLLGELMRLALVDHRSGSGPALHIQIRSAPEGGFRLLVRPGNGRGFVFAGREAEIETLEVLAEQIRGRLEATDPARPAKEWILVVPPSEMTRAASPGFGF